ncbi:Protein UPSTREAM OF FLC [Quillaja saponaria]|uniref:Protein UPSTREAM OF FLC n=1 Tax=Quillaja saponaria TaxID=32244 RepID=A0AAD7L0A5_QUISA|nr:Protein UPSTREAM OF FLC [Quillaja saponaria]
MEAKNCGEVRRLHIIYFLSRMGRIEQPHLVRVHHLSRYGVYLRDVKRWLADLRGKDMPEAFAWSYKRRYKNGYVWQDLVDDDLITPISDNEYVLKGSEINHTPFDTSLLGEKKASILVEQKKTLEVQAGDNKLDFQRYPDSTTDIPTKFSSEISQESPPYSSERSTTTDEYDSSKLEEDKQNQHEQSYENSEKNSSSSFYLNLLNKKKNNKDNSTNKTGTKANSLSSAPPTSFTKIKSYSNGASHMFRNLITCGTVDTNETAVVMLNRADKTGAEKTNLIHDHKAEICKGDKLGGSARHFGTSWNHQQQQCSGRKSYDGGKSSNMNQKTVSAAYKPFRGPTCSQCGKPFKPEKMHKHMKSCRGMKTSAKTAATPAEKTSFQSSNISSRNIDSSGYLITN